MIKARLGAGGMGDVYRATQVDVGRDVALKLLRSDSIGDDETVKRFYREFKILSRLQHSHIVTIYGLALDEQNVPYAVCEFIEGRSLRSVLQQGALDWQRACKLLIQICDAMQYAHEQQVVHRDLKPDNIMLLDKPEADFVKIIDFGLSRAAIVELDESQKLTFTGQLLGTPNYMSPEMTPNSLKAEIYSLGCIMFEMLAGEFLFDADTAVGTLYLHANTDPATRFGKIKAAPFALYHVMKKALAKSPDERYASMKDFQKSLEEIMKDPSNIIAGAAFNEHKRAPLRINTKLLVGALIVTSILAIGSLAPRKNENVSKMSEGFGSLKYTPISKLPSRLSNNIDLITSETWIKENLQSTRASYEDIATIAWHSLRYRRNHGMSISPPYAEELLVKIHDAARHVRNSKQKMLLILREARLCVLLKQPDKALELVKQVIPHGLSDDLIYTDELKLIIDLSTEFGEDPKPFLALVNKVGLASTNYMTIASVYLLDANFSSNENERKTLALKAYHELVNADIAGMSSNPSLVLECIEQLRVVGCHQEVIRLGENVSAYFETISEVSYLIQHLVAQSYLDSGQTSKGLRLAKSLREKLMMRPIDNLLDDSECVVIEALSGRDFGSNVARDEAKNYFDSIYANYPGHLHESMPKIFAKLDSRKKARWRLNYLVDEYADKLAMGYPETSRALRMFRIRLIMKDRLDHVPDPLTRQGKQESMSRARNLLKDFSSSNLVGAIDLKTLDDLSEFFAKSGLENESKQCKSMKATLEAGLIKNIRR